MTQLPPVPRPDVAPPAVDVIDYTAAPARLRGGGTGRRLVAGVAAAGVAAVAVAGVAAAQWLTGAGTQPEQVLPASTVAFAKIDLNPSAGQKANALRLLAQLPQVDVADGDLKETVFAEMFADRPFGLSWETDVAGWVGNRVAVAAVPAPGTEDNLTPVLVVEVTDETKMAAALDKAEAALAADQSPFGMTPPEIGYAVRDGYVLIGDDQAEIDRAAAASSTLADADGFAADVAAVDADGLPALGWADVGAAYRLLPADERAGYAEAVGGAEPSGRLVAALAVEPDLVEVRGAVRGVGLADQVVNVSELPGTGLAGTLPADTEIAVAATGLGQAATDLWDRYGDTEWASQAAAGAAGFGWVLPEDLAPVLGTELAAGISVTRATGVATVRTGDPDRAAALLGPLAAPLGQSLGGRELTVRTTGDRYVIGTDPDQVASVADGGTGLAGNPAFTRAVADHDTAQALAYVDLAAVAETFGGTDDLGPVEAFGASATGTAEEGRFTLRVTLRR